MSKVNRDLFYKLASELSEERVQAAVSIIKELSDLPLPEGNEEWKYVLNRLIKGLSSDRNGARLGFSLCLTEVVNLAIELSSDNDSTKIPDCLPNIEEFLTLLSSTLSLEPEKSNKKRKGKEERGLLFGKLFGLQCLLNEPLFNNIFFQKEGKNVSNFSITFMKELLELSQYKNWIREPCLYTLFQTINKLIPFANDKFIASIIHLLDEYKMTLTNEGLAIYLTILHNDKKFDLSNITLQNNGWKNNDPLSRGNLPLLTDVLRQSSVSKDENSTVSQANWTPRLHFVWKVLLPIICHTSSENTEHVNKKRKKEKEIIKFGEFWQMAVDESFFNEKSSSERKFLGFLIFEKTIGLINAHWTPYIFSQNFMRSLINQSTDSKRMLHKISQKTLNMIVDACNSDGHNKLVPTLKALLFDAHGSINFDKLTKSKTVAKLIATQGLSDAIFEQLFTIFYSNIPSSIETDLSMFRFILDTTLHIVRSHKANIKTQLATTLLKPIIILSFYTKENEQLNELARERLYSILGELTGQKTENHSWQYYALEIIIELENDTDSDLELVNKLDDSLVQVRQDAMEVLSDISNLLEREGQDLPKLHGMESLISMCLLQLYSGDVESVSVIEELCSFYNSQSNDKNDSSLVGITEILLSLLAQKKAILRRISLSVWEQFISDVGSEELKLLLDVLSARENKQGFSQLFEGVDDYEEEEEDDEEKKDGENDDSEKENDDDDESNESSSDEENDDDSEDDSEDIDNDKVASIDKETSSALAKALNLPENIINENGEVKFDELSDFSGDDESDEESMDDEKMMELDDQLSEIFKRRKEALSSIPTGNQRKNDVKMSRENVISFKHRVVEMLEIYVKYFEKGVVEVRKGETTEAVDASNLLMFIVPMITCVRETLDKSLCDKISKLLKSKVFKMALSAFGGVEETVGFELINEVHEKLTTAKSGHFSTNYYSLCSSSSIFLGKILLENNKDKKENSEILEKLIDLYCDTTKKWMIKGKFGVNVFIDFYNWLSSKKQ